MTDTKEARATRMERKKEATKKKILDVAMELFKTQGVDATTMEQIAMEADIAKGTLYNYFPVKEAIIDEHMKRSFKERNSDRIMQLRSLPDTRSRITLILTELVAGINEHKDIFEKYMVYHMQRMVSFQPEESAKSGFYLIGAEIIQLGQKSGELRDDVPFDILRELFEFAFVEIVKQCYLQPDKLAIEKLISLCVDLFLNGAGRTTEKF